MVFVRGQSQDYDTWAQLGNRGWSYREVLPIFKEMESYQGSGDDEYRGRNGPLRVSENNETGALYDALIKAAGEVGIAYTQDYNGARLGRSSQIGSAPIPRTGCWCWRPAGKATPGRGSRSVSPS